MHPVQMVSAHKCALCNQGFPTSKALGGHVSQYRFSESIESFERKGELQEGKVIFKKHKNSCGVCNEQFDSANSLLGHMDMHKEEEVRKKDGHSSAEASSSCVVPGTRTALDFLREIFGCSSSTAGCEKRSPGRLLFVPRLDLNKPPSPE